MALCVVQKPFKGNGDHWQRDQLVEATIFRNGQTLIDQRFLRPATPDEISSAYEASESEESAPKKKGGLKARKRKKA